MSQIVTFSQLGTVQNCDIFPIRKRKEIKMEKKTRTWTKWLYWFTFAIAVIIIYKTVDNLGQITNWIKNL